MRTSRKLHKTEIDKDKLHDALRELYRDGVRVLTGEPEARSKIAAVELAAEDGPVVPELADWESDAGMNPYDHKPEK